MLKEISSIQLCRISGTFNVTKKKILFRLRPAEMEMKPFPQMERTEPTRHNGSPIPENAVYECPVFGKPPPKNKGSFVISPDWTSERKEPRKSYR